LKTLHKISFWLWAALKPLGSWGVFAIAGIDSAGVPLPGASDAIVASYVYNDPRKAWLYVLMAALGSALGCCVIYAVGYAGGEMLLQDRMPAGRFNRIRASFERHRFLALAFPAMLPPPFPFKLFVLAAAAFEVTLPHFLLAIILGRLARYGALALLTIQFGPQVVMLTGTLLRRHLAVTLATLAAVVIAVVLWRRRGRAPLSQAIQ
jgi:membrane protein YqaA with SNARE-associated domain